MSHDTEHIAAVEAVVTSCNQGRMILEAVHSLCAQTLPPKRIVVVDDGSTDGDSLDMLRAIEADAALSVPVTVVRQPNGGVSAARNAGIRRTEAPLVLVLDGDDRLRPPYIERVCRLLGANASMVAASSWMRAFGALDATVRPAGGGIGEFLARNACPAAHILRRGVWERCGGYDETMRSGFEDWDFFLSMLEAAPGGSIGIVPEPLIEYRTAPASSNVRSMTKRLDLMRGLIRKHGRAYRDHLEDAVIGLEAISISRLCGWEEEICHALGEGRPLSPASEAFVISPTYGDGGMAAAVRIASAKKP